MGERIANLQLSMVADLINQTIVQSDDNGPLIDGPQIVRHIAGRSGPADSPMHLLISMRHHHRLAWLGGWLLAGWLSLAAEDMNPAATRDYLIQTWQTEKGLPQNWVSSIAQTPEGYLWIGTRYGGLARFDGVRFVPFNQQNTPELKDVQVEHLHVDITGRLWVMMGNESLTSFHDGHFELCRQPRSQPRLRLDHVLDIQSNTILFAGEGPYLAIDTPKATPEWQVLDPRDGFNPDPTTFTCDQNGTIWFASQDHRLVRYRQGHFEYVTTGLPEEGAVALGLDREFRLWLASPHRLGIWSENRFSDCTPAGTPIEDAIQQIAASGDGGVWVLGKKRLRKYLRGEWVAECQPANLFGDLSSSQVALHGDNQGNAWLVVYGRGLLHCKADGTTHIFTERNGLPSRFITCWFQDAEGNVWIGMHGGGIARIRERLFRAYGMADGLPDKVVSSTCLDHDGRLWVGMMSGEVFCWQNGRFAAIPLPAPAGTPNESITVFPAADGSMYIGSLNHGLFQYRNGTFTRPPTTWDTVRVLFQDRSEQLWVGALVNLYLQTPKGFRIFSKTDGFVDSHAIGALAEDATGNLWIGTGPGDLWKYSSGQFTRYTPPAGWPAVRFAALLPETNGTVWIGTLGGGLLRFQDGQFTRCLQADGLPDNNVPQLLDSQDGYLWGGTYAGIFRAAKKDLTAVAAGKSRGLNCRVYSEYDGLPAMECSSGFHPACWQGADSTLWFSTANGVTSVNPHATIPNYIPPTVIIEEMLVDGQPQNIPMRIGVSLPVAKASRPVEIPPGRHYVQFRYTGLSFAAPDGVRFKVRLEGGDGNWQNVGSQREFGYGPLVPGHYRIHVAACNNDGIWNEVGDTFAFTVLPHFWETRWFKLSLGMGLLCSIGVAAAWLQRRRYRRRLERVERQREMEQERSRIARDLHDDLGTSLTQISLLSALANRETTPPAETRDLIQEIRSRAKNMVIALDEIVWAVNPRNDNLAGLVSYLGHFAEEFLRAAGIRLRLDLPGQLPAHSLSTEVRHHVFLAFKEALNNAVRHSGAKLVQLRVEHQATALVISIIDDGQGFTSPDGMVGDGLANMRRRLEHLGGTAQLKSRPGEGTQIIFTLPLTP